MDDFQEGSNIKDATPKGFGASMLDAAGSGADSKARYAKQEPRRSMLDAFNEITRRKNAPEHRVRPLEVLNEQLQGQWPEQPVQAVEQTTSAASRIHPLQLVDATTGGDAKILIRTGNTAGRLAIAGMTDPGYTSAALAAGTKYFYAEVTIGYGAPIWTSSASTIAVGASVPASTATLVRFELGHCIVESDGSGGTRVQTGSIHQEVLGSQLVARVGNGSSYVDYNRTV